MTTSILMIGAGGHARVLLDILNMNDHVQVLGILDTNPDMFGKKILDIEILGDDSELKHFPPAKVQLVNGIGSIHLPQKRCHIFKKMKAQGYDFFSVLHPQTYIARDVILQEGVQVMAGSVIQTGSQIGDNVIVNTRTAIDHDCMIHPHVHLAPGVTLSGNVTVGELSHVGTGAIIMQGIQVGENSLVGVGAVVIRDVLANSQVIGVPAQERRK
jgi:sugar O-acyltransferase (sialic acid O-acetyltransferase NeuD family)